MLKGLATYQGFCHSCQKGYYYPAGDCMAEPSDSRALKCALCKYRPKDDPNRAVDFHLLVHAGLAVYIDKDGIVDLSKFGKDD
jgi:predicted amidophosphoribosyltransferase